MKMTKRFLSSLLVVMLMAAMLVVPAHAENTHSITISGASGHTFTAHQIFTGDLSGAVLSNIVWGNGVNQDNLLTALKDSTYFDTKFDSCTTAADVALVLEADSWKEADTMEFAKIVAGNLNGTGTAGSESGTDYVISGLAAGYYIVKDTSDLDGKEDAYSRYIIQVTSNTAVAIKNAMPTLQKKVSLTNASGFAEAVSAGIGNEVYFSLTATMHSRIEDYSAYGLEFVDTLPAGLDFGKIEAVYVNSTKLTDTSAVAVSDSDSDKTYTFNVPDAKSIISTATGSTQVSPTDRLTIVFSATVNGSGGLVYGGDGNINEAVLHYPNDPNGGSTTGVTAPATARVYTYQLLVNKKDATTNTALQGATFIVHFLDDGGATKYVQATGSDGVYTTTGTTTSKDAATPLTTNSAGQITLKGLRERDYHLTETQAPDSYNKITDDQTVNIDATLNASTGELTALTATKTGSYTTVDKTSPDNGTVEITIVNHQGAVLPSTGGMGTTIFYIAGAALMIGAAAVLVTKKRETEK